VEVAVAEVAEAVDADRRVDRRPHGPRR
jgi:hypothetical protein